MSKRTIFDVLGPPKNKRDLPSGGPGTGPTQRDSQINMPRVVIPKTDKSNQLGYGGGGDAVDMSGILPQGASPQHFDGDVRELVKKRFPGLAHMGPPAPLVPRYNILYDTHRTRDAWRYISDDVVTINFTPTGNGTFAFPVVPTANGGLFKARLSQYPGAIHMLLCIRSFSYASLAATSGAIEFRFQSVNGDVVPLGIWSANGQTGVQGITAVCPTPITDNGLASYGNLIFISSNYGTSAASSVQLGFSFVYVTPDPAFRGYNQESGETFHAAVGGETEAILRRN